MELFGQLQVLNVFNQSQLCGCGQAVSQNGGAVNAARIDQTVRILQTFNPFTTVPVEGVQWAKGPNFGTGFEPAGVYVAPRLSGVVWREILNQPGWRPGDLVNQDHQVTDSPALPSPSQAGTVVCAISS